MSPGDRPAGWFGVARALATGGRGEVRLGGGMGSQEDGNGGGFKGKGPGRASKPIREWACSSVMREVAADW
jgi:hypothetical protein